MLVPSITERIKARGDSAQIDDGKKKCRERIELEMRSDPGKAEGKSKNLVRSVAKKLSDCYCQRR
jgi:hypothetical protein